MPAAVLIFFDAMSSERDGGWVVALSVKILTDLQLMCRRCILRWTAVLQVGLELSYELQLRRKKD